MAKPILTVALALLAAGASQAMLGWSVLEARWRPDRNESAKQQVWEGWRWTEGWGHDEQYYPKYFVPGGSVHVVLRNDTGSEKTIKLAQGEIPFPDQLTSPKWAREIVWYRLDCPRWPVTEATGGRQDVKIRKVPAGQWVECVIRFRHVPKTPGRVLFDVGAGRLDLTVDVSSPKTRIEYIGFSPKIDRVFCYLRNLDGSGFPKGKLLLDGKDASKSARWIEGPPGTGVSLVQAKLTSAWDYATCHLVQLELEDGTRLAQPVRAWDCYFSIGLFGDPKKQYVQAAKEKGFNTYYWSDATEVLAAGLNHIPAFSYGKDPIRTPDKPGVLFNYNIDEPDCNDWTAGGDLPIPDRLGVNAEQVVLPRIEVMRKDSPKVPALLLIDNTFKPLNYYMYGQMSDVIASDPYQLLGLDQVDYVRHVMECVRDASTPRPTVAVLWAGGFVYNEGREVFPIPKTIGDPRVRPPSPAEERMMAFYALGAGAKGIGYFCDWPDDANNKQPDGVFVQLSQNKPLWEEVGRINADIAALAPYLSIGCPVSVPQEDPRVWISEIMCGPDNVVVTVVNKDHYIAYNTINAFEFHNLAKDAVLDVPLPGGFERGTCTVSEVVNGKLVPADARFSKRGWSRRLETVDTARAFLITKNSSSTENK